MNSRKRTFIFLAGSQGSGKTRHGQNITNFLGYNYFSVGDMLREIATQNPDCDINRSLSSGHLVSDTEINNLFKQHVINQPGDWIIDGYPRTNNQLINCLAQVASHMVVLVQFHAPKLVIYDRLKGRGRADDTETAILARLKIWQEETSIVINTFANFNNVYDIRIDTNREKDTAFKELQTKLCAILPQATVCSVL